MWLVLCLFGAYKSIQSSRSLTLLSPSWRASKSLRAPFELQGEEPTGSRSMRIGLNLLPAHLNDAKIEISTSCFTGCSTASTSVSLVVNMLSNHAKWLKQNLTGLVRILPPTPPNLRPHFNMLQFKSASVLKLPGTLFWFELRRLHLLANNKEIIPLTNSKIDISLFLAKHFKERVCRDVPH